MSSISWPILYRIHSSVLAALVRAGLPAQIQKALDVVRVTGNNAVHPGKIDFDDGQETAISLLRLINLIVEKMITEKNQIDALFDGLPKAQKDAIARRDQPSSKPSSE